MTALLLAALLPAGEPEFNGRPLSQWLVVLKEDDTPRRRRAAAVALGQIGAANPETLSVVLPALGKAIREDASPVVRLQATTAVGQQKAEDTAPAARDLAEALRSERDTPVRRELAAVLGRLGRAAKPAVGPLMSALADADPTVRATAADALGRIGSDAGAATPELLKCLADADKRVRLAAVFAVGRIAPPDPTPSAAALVRVLKADADADLRREALVSLGFVGDRSPSTVAAVAAVLTDPAVEMRKTAAVTLAKFGSAGKGSVAELKSAVSSDSDKSIRVIAVQSLCAVHTSDEAGLVPYLAERLKLDTDFEVRVAILERFGAMGKTGRAALPAVRLAQRDPQMKVREAATAALKRIDGSTQPDKP